MAQSSQAPNTREEIRGRTLGTEEMIRRQLERITEIRSNVDHPRRAEAWSEANEALADLLISWTDNDKEREHFHREWEERPIAVVYGPSGEMIPVATVQDCRIAQQILMRMMDRAGLSVKRRKTSGPNREPPPGLPMELGEEATA